MRKLIGLGALFVLVVLGIFFGAFFAAHYHYGLKVDQAIRGAFLTATLTLLLFIPLWATTKVDGLVFWSLAIAAGAAFLAVGSIIYFPPLAMLAASVFMGGAVNCGLYYARRINRSGSTVVMVLAGVAIAIMMPMSLFIIYFPKT